MYSFVVMPFGLAGAPGTFQWLTQEVFMEELGEFITVYLDDVLVYSKTWQEHVQRSTKTFEQLRQHGLMLKRKKCCFARERVTYLVFVVGARGIRPDPEKTRTILEWPEILSNRQQTRAFLGMVGYYRRLIPNCNKSAYPLHQLLKEDAPNIWSQQHTQAVRELKEKAIQAKPFDPTL